MMKKIFTHKINQYLIVLTTVCISIIFLSGCSFTRHAIAMMESTDHFIQSEDDPRILFEAGAADYAYKISSLLPTAIRQIEIEQYQKFPKPVQIYVCASRESFKKYFGADVYAGVLTKLFLSPRIFENGDDIAEQYLIHELSHLHLLQQLGLYKMSRLPFWFKEGLATYVSNGGGASQVSKKKAIEFIRTEKHFIPNQKGGFVFQKTPSDFGIKPHMFYRQSMLFVEYLKIIDQEKFKNFILSIENGSQFSSAIYYAYNKELKDLWSEFINKINKIG